MFIIDPCLYCVITVLLWPLITSQTCSCSNNGTVASRSLSLIFIKLTLHARSTCHEQRSLCGLSLNTFVHAVKYCSASSDMNHVGDKVPTLPSLLYRSMLVVLCLLCYKDTMQQGSPQPNSSTTSRVTRVKSYPLVP